MTNNQEPLEPKQSNVVYSELGLMFNSLEELLEKVDGVDKIISDILDQCDSGKENYPDFCSTEIIVKPTEDLYCLMIKMHKFI
jgi:hypothetical protein